MVYRITPNSESFAEMTARESVARIFGSGVLMEKWSDAARAASAAARKAKGGRAAKQKAARDAYLATPGGRRMATQSAKADFRQAKRLRIKGMDQYYDSPAGKASIAKGKKTLLRGVRKVDRFGGAIKRPRTTHDRWRSGFGSKRAGHGPENY